MKANLSDRFHVSQIAVRCSIVRISFLQLSLQAHL